MVKLYAKVLNVKLNLSSIQPYRNYSTDRVVKDYDIKIGNDNNNKGNKEFKPSPTQGGENKPVKILVENPYNNRDIILKLTKKQKGVYI